MARFSISKKEEIGLSPDALHFRGIKKSDDVILKLIDYDSKTLNEIEFKTINEAVKYNNTKTTSWFNIDGIHDDGIMQEISEKFELDSLILSDVMNTYARPKVQEYDNCLYISLKMLQFDEGINQISSENLVIIIKQNILISFQELTGDVFEPVRERIRKSKKRMRNSGTDYLAFALIDLVFENYKYIISRIGERIESIEEKLLNNPQVSILEDIHNYKKEIIYLKRAIKPSKEVITDLIKTDSDFLGKSISVHLLELQDNINHITESIESYSEILTNQLNIYHTTLSNKMNEIIKFLTVFSVIFIPLTFIVGVYGTNFDVLPEIHYDYGYFIMWGVMILIVLSMIYYFKRKKWF